MWICIHNSVELGETRCSKTPTLCNIVQVYSSQMHNLIPLNQLNGSTTKDKDLVAEYYECLVECEENQAVCKRICKEVLIN